MNHRLKVVQLGSPAGMYGAERWIIALVRYLDPEKVDSWVATVRDDPALEAPLCAQARESGFKTHIVEAHGRVNFKAVKALRAFLVSNRIDILHTHGYKQDSIGLLAVLGTSCRILSTPHGWSMEGGFKLGLYEAMNRVIFHFFDAVVPLSGPMHDGLKRVLLRKNNLFLIRNGVDIQEVRQACRIHPDILEWKRQGMTVIGYVGRLVPSKGLDTLFRALALPSNDGQPWRIALVGEGEQMDALNQLASELGIKDRIRFFGFRKDRLAFLKGFDLFVLPSRTEGTPRCLMEAMAAGVPVAASDIPGCRALISHGETGLLFDVDQPEQLSDALHRLMDKDLRKRVTANAEAFLTRHYSALRMAKEYETLYVSMAGKTHV